MPEAIASARELYPRRCNTSTTSVFLDFAERIGSLQPSVHLCRNFYATRDKPEGIAHRADTVLPSRSRLVRANGTVFETKTKKKNVSLLVLGKFSQKSEEAFNGTLLDGQQKSTRVLA